MQKTKGKMLEKICVFVGETLFNEDEKKERNIFVPVNWINYLFFLPIDSMKTIEL